MGEGIRSLVSCFIIVKSFIIVSRVIIMIAEYMLNMFRVFVLRLLSWRIRSFR